MSKKYRNNLITFSLLVLFLVGLIFILSIFDAVEIVEKIGVRHSYLMIFLVSLFGGFSAGGSAVFISVLITLVTGGLNPLYAGLLAGTSLAIGDTLMFYIGSRGRELVTGKWDERIKKVAAVFKKRPWLEKLTPVLAYLYIGFAPLPNDLLLIFLAAIEYPMKKLVPIIILGDLTFALGISFLAWQALV